MNEHNQPAGFYFWNAATVFWWRCPTRAVRNCQTSVLVAGACRSSELLTMLPLPHFYTAPKWAQANLMDLLSACPSRLFLLYPDHCYLRKKHCSSSHLPVVSFNMTDLLFLPDGSLLLRLLLVLDSHLKVSVTFGERKRRHVSHNVRLVLRVHIRQPKLTWQLEF